MHENVLASVLWSYEAESFGVVVPFDPALRPGGSSEADDMYNNIVS